MKLPNIFGSKSAKIERINGYISTKNEVKTSERFKGEVRDPLIKFPKTLGVEHPFDFEAMGDVYKTVGVVTGAVNKITDSVVGDFSFKTRTTEGYRIVADFIKNNNFTSVLREWIREGFVKGNGFLELDVMGKGLKVLNANDMYVKRDTKANVKEYRQWVGDLKRYSRDSAKLITFKPQEIAHLRINKIAGEAYGIGIIYQNERTIENMVLNEQDLQKLISRKAGAPIHAAVGREGEATSKKGIDEFKESLQVMTNRTEWVTDSNVKLSVIDFGQIGKNLTDILDHDMLVIAYGMEIPIVLFGGGNIPEGLAKAQSEIFQRKMSVIQEEIESIIEEQIFNPLLKENGIDDEVDFTWNLPGEEEINNRIEKLTKLIEIMNTSEPLRRMCELEIAKLLNLEDAHKYLPKPEKVSKDVKKPTKPDKEKIEKLFEEFVKVHESPDDKIEKYFNEFAKEQELQMDAEYGCDMTLEEFVNLKETSELKYSDYLDNILERLKIDKFEYLAATSKAELANGKLPKTQIEKLRAILEEGFRANKTVAQIEAEIKEKMKLKDVKKEGVIIVAAALRPGMIARTEPTRVANLGLVDTFIESGFKKGKWHSVLSSRTCERCRDLHGRVFDLKSINPPPIHPKCECSILPVKE